MTRAASFELKRDDEEGGEAMKEIETFPTFYKSTKDKRIKRLLFAVVKEKKANQ
jgi:hypothetical protein